jgi:hypothetical protein
VELTRPDHTGRPSDVFDVVGEQELDGSSQAERQAAVVGQITAHDLREVVIGIQHVDLVGRCAAHAGRLPVRVGNERNIVRHGKGRDLQTPEFDARVSVLVREPHIRRPATEDADAAAHLLPGRLVRQIPVEARAW